MTLRNDSQIIERLAVAIARSQGAQPQSLTYALPAGFEDLDIAVLDWIAVEARRLGRAAKRVSVTVDLF
jgi:hypothetical protein